MDNETVFERIKEDLRVTARRALTDTGNNFEAVKDGIETALDIVLIELADKFYK